jgi:hypothetical protein
MILPLAVNQPLFKKSSVSTLGTYPSGKLIADNSSTDYSPSKVAAGVAGGLYLLSGVGLLVRLILARSWWGLCLPIAAFCKLLWITLYLFAKYLPQSPVRDSLCALH